MAKWIADAILDLPLAKIATATRLVICSGQPANYAGIAAVALADIALTPGNGNGDFTIANGDVSGRKLTTLQQATIPIDSNGDATHITLDDGTDLLAATTCTTQTLTAGGTATVPAWDTEFADPV